MSHTPFGSISFSNIKILADELRVKVHLAGMDLKGQWKAFEPKLRDLEERLQEARAKAKTTLTEQVGTLRASLRKLAQELRDSVQKQAGAPDRSSETKA